MRGILVILLLWRGYFKSAYAEQMNTKVTLPVDESKIFFDISLHIFLLGGRSLGRSNHNFLWLNRTPRVFQS